MKTIARRVRHIDRVIGLVVAAVLASLFGWTTPSKAAPVEYVKVCSLYGAGYFYIPGTDTCQNANQITANQFAIGRDFSRLETGVAMAGALVSPFLPDGTNYAISGHWANFAGKDAFGLAGLIRIKGNLVLSGGIAAGINDGSQLGDARYQTEFGTQSPYNQWNEVDVLTRVGFMYAW